MTENLQFEKKAETLKKKKVATMYPLSPAQAVSLNRSPASRRYDTMALTTTSKDDQDDGDVMSSPLVSNTSALTTATAKSNTSDQENANNTRDSSKSAAPSPVKSRHSRIISGTELSPLKILSRKRSSEEALLADGRERRESSGSGNSMGPPAARSPRKISSPEKRFPVKIGGADEEAGSSHHYKRMMLEDAIRKNPKLQPAIDIFEDEEDNADYEKADSNSFMLEQKNQSRPGTATSGIENESIMEMGSCAFNPDESMASTFSTFSAVPTMTAVASWRQQQQQQQSLAKAARLAAVASRPSTRDESEKNTTNLLLDFTDSLRHPGRSPEKKHIRAGGDAILPSSMTAPSLNTAGMTTPSKATPMLIDFDFPPMPTPRSLPTVSAREVESIKSEFLSEISALRASLSGKDAEVRSLKSAVGDAEKRVGESMQKLREEAAMREQMSAERDDWESRGREMDKVLHTLREQLLHGQREREEAENKLEESEKRREAAEILHQEAESKMAGLRAGKESEASSEGGGAIKAKSPQQISKEVEFAVERVARDLHALYKGKHQMKVAALKKSYEARWEKKVKELETKLASVSEENDMLRASQNSDDTVLVTAQQQHADADKEQASRDRATIREMTANTQRLEAVVASVQEDNQELRVLLEKERVEKGELVQLAEEMMSMQTFVGSSSKAASSSQHTTIMMRSAAPVMPEPQQQSYQQQYGTKTPGRTPGRRPLSLQQPAPSTSTTTTTPGRRTSFENRRGSVGKASGLRAPGSAYRAAAVAGSAMRIPGSRSGILHSIEKMGSHRPRAP